MKIRKTLSLILALFFTCSLLILPTNAEEATHTPPSLSAQSALLMEAQNGSIAYEKNAHKRLPMASTTKIMTALVALELASPTTVITVDERAVGTEGSSVYLCAGEKLTLEDLLYALMLESANDAAIAIAIGICGSEDAFVDAMNSKSNSLGLSNTHFANPHGLDAETHYTTAYELAIIAREALQNPLLKTIVSTRKTTIPHQSTNSVRLLVNHNKMLRLYEGCIGLKTGYTQKSGRCLVSAAERNGVTMIAVTIDSPDDWNDHTKLFNFGFSNYRSIELSPADFQICLPVIGSQEPYVILGVTQGISVTLPLGSGVVEQITECPRHIFAPVKAGDICGQMLFFCDTNGDGIKELLQTVPLIAKHSVQKHAERLSFWQRFLLWWRRLFS